MASKRSIKGSAPSNPSSFDKVVSLIRASIRCWLDDEAPRLAASLAYYALLSLAPLVVLAIALAGLQFGEEAAKGQIAREVATVVGPEAGTAIQSIVANAKAPGSGIVSTIIGVVVLLFGASGAFGELQAALDRIWAVKPRPGRGLLGIIKDRTFSLAMVLSVAFLLMVSLVVSAAVSAAGRFFQTSLPGGEVLSAKYLVIIEVRDDYRGWSGADRLDAAHSSGSSDTVELTRRQRQYNSRQILIPVFGPSLA